MTKTGAASLSILSNTVLIILKVAVGIATGSVSVISEAIHSGMDLIASLVAFFSVRVSDKAPDDHHPYGHGKVENVSGAIEALLILAAAFWILWESAHKIVGGKPMSMPMWGIAVMGISAVVNIVVSRILYQTARRTGSLALEADALHLKADVYTSLGVALGLTLLAIFKWPILDPLVAMAVALFITREAIMLLNKAMQPLLDKAFETDELKSVTDLLSREKCDYHKLRTRKSGTDRFIDMHLMFPKDATLRAAHQKTRDLKAKLREIFPAVDVTIHMEPRESPGGGPRRKS